MIDKKTKSEMLLVNGKNEVLLSLIKIDNQKTTLQNIIFLDNGNNEYKFNKDVKSYITDLLESHILNKSYTFILHDPVECFNLNKNKKLLSFIKWSKKIGIYDRLSISTSYLNFKGNIPFKYFPFFLGRSIDQNHSMVNKNIDKRFLFLNRIPKLHRVNLYDFLEVNNILDDCYWSFGCDEPYGIIKYYTRKIYPNKSLSDTLTLNDMHSTLPEYDKSFLSIVTESFFYTTHRMGDSEAPWLDYEHQISNTDYDSSIPIIDNLGNLSNKFIDNRCYKLIHPNDFPIATFVTEKTEKCFTALHPFIMVSTPYFLRHLKELGFKTFDKWWDESYDEIEDDNARLKQIFKIILEISEWDMYKCKKVLSEMKNILRWNQNLNVKYHEEKRNKIHLRYPLTPPLI